MRHFDLQIRRKDGHLVDSRHFEVACNVTWKEVSIELAKAILAIEAKNEPEPNVSSEALREITIDLQGKERAYQITKGEQ